MRILKAECLRVEKKDGESALAYLRKQGLVDHGLKIRPEKNQLLIPLVHAPTESERKELSAKVRDFALGSVDFPARTRRPKTLADVLEGKIPAHLLASLPRSADLIGNVAVIEIPEELVSYKGLIGESLLRIHPRVHTVLGKVGGIRGEFRLREFEVLAGKGETRTVHREHGCLYHLDLASTFFTPRLAYERLRVAEEAKPQEVILDMFAGVGPFSILTAKRCGDVKVFAIDKNPGAFRYLCENVTINRATGAVVSVLGDSATTARYNFRGTADRIIMNLPAESAKFVGVACELIKPSGGILHYYAFSEENDPIEAVRNELHQSVASSGREVVEFLLARRVRSTGPRQWQVGVDARIR